MGVQWTSSTRKMFKQMRIAEGGMKPYDNQVVDFSGERVSTWGYTELYTTFARGWGEQDHQNLVSSDRCQHLLWHPAGMTVHQQVEGDRFHTSSDHEIPVGIGRHSHDACRLESSTTMLRNKPKGKAYMAGRSLQLIP